MKNELEQAYERTSLPVNPLPFLQYAYDQVREHGSGWLTTLPGKKIMWSLNAMAFGCIATIDMADEWNRLHNIDNKKEEVPPQTDYPDVPKITKKSYRCFGCDKKTEHETNHYGEIYEECKNCGSIVLYCSEEIAVDARNKLPKMDAKLVYYRFELDDEKQREKYDAMCRKLETVYDLWKDAKTNFLYQQRKVKVLKDKIYITIYEPANWEQQFTTSVGRLHSWFEMTFHNKRIKEGYYLTDKQGFLSIKNIPA